MGQHSSCIQGNPDWLGPYRKSSGKDTESEFYDHLRKFTASGSNKDLHDFENFLKSKVNPACPQHGSRTLLEVNQKQSLGFQKHSTLPIMDKFEDLIHKESHCKDVNFSTTEKDTKPSSIKPIIINKSSCLVHGNAGENALHTKSPPCKVHGNQNTKFTRGNIETKQIVQEKLPLPPYKYPPQFISTHLIPENSLISQNLKVTHEEEDTLCDDDSSTFSCPDFLKNLILPSDEPETVDVLASVGVKSAKETIQKLEDRAENIVETFGVVLKHLEHGDWSTFCISTSRLCDDIRKTMRDYHLNSETEDLAALKIKNHVTGALNKLTTHILSLNQEVSTESNHNVLLPSFKTLGEVLHEMMEFLISKELRVLIECLNHNSNNSCIRMAICALAEMSLSGRLMCKLIVEAGAIPPLLGICKIHKCNYLRPLALRTLTAICSFQEAVDKFEEISGFNTIMNILSEESEEKILSETVGLLAQVLKQWSENNCPIAKKIGHNQNQLVKYLTGTAQKALSPEMFLLSAACLATLSTFNIHATNWLQVHAQEMRLLASNTKQESYV